LVAVVFALLPAIAFAQFGHPLKGQWSGEWGPKASPSRLLLDIAWDGKQLTGTINPGTDSEGTFKTVTIDYSAVTSWKVRIDGEVKEAGKTVPVRVTAHSKTWARTTKCSTGHGRRARGRASSPSAGTSAR
jgi:hypothetical protein